MEQSRFTYLYQRFQQQSLSHDEYREFAELLQQTDDPELVKAVVALAENAAASPVHEPLSHTDEAFHRIVNIDKVRRIHFLRRSFLKYAAAILLLIGAAVTAIVVFSDRQPGNKDQSNTKNIVTNIIPGRDRAVLALANGKTIVLDSTQGNIVQQDGFKVINMAGKLDYEGKSGKVEYHTLSTPRGGQYKLQLPDGTAVWLNAASSISYPTAFVGKERKVSITGEVYFEVAKNKEKPFIVNVNDLSEIEVLGTHFNVNSYVEEGSIKTTLLEGAVRIKQQAENVVLRPGQQAQLNTTAVDRKLIVADAVDIARVMAWKNGLFNFNGADVRTVMRQLERWYDINVKYEGAVPDILFQGELDRHVSFSDMLEILPALGIKYRLEDRQLIVTK